jgi:hypothetical protein
MPKPKAKSTSVSTSSHRHTVTLIRPRQRARAKAKANVAVVVDPYPTFAALPAPPAGLIFDEPPPITGPRDPAHLSLVTLTTAMSMAAELFALDWLSPEVALARDVSQIKPNEPEWLSVCRPMVEPPVSHERMRLHRIQTVLTYMMHGIRHKPLWKDFHDCVELKHRVCAFLYGQHAKWNPTLLLFTCTVCMRLDLLKDQLYGLHDHAALFSSQSNVRLALAQQKTHFTTQIREHVLTECEDVFTPLMW